MDVRKHRLVASLCGLSLAAGSACTSPQGTRGHDAEEVRVRPPRAVGHGSTGGKGAENGGGDDEVDGGVPPGEVPVGYEPYTRRYYVAAEEVEWDYAPSDQNVTMGRTFSESEEVFVEGDGDTLIGDTYKKALFVEYTDDSFTERAPVARRWKHTGNLGPVIRGVVGDTIEVVFKNKTSPDSTSCEGGPCRYSIHPHGVFYTKSSEGAASNDGAKDAGLSADDSVAPGDTHTYVWQVPERAGPAEDDGSSVVWPYHSHVSSVEDSNAGLFGVILITAAEHGTKSGRPDDIDTEVISVFTVTDENVSHYLADNIEAHAPNALEDEFFEESNLMHVINGYVYGNGPMPTMHVGDRVRWYLVSEGTEVDLHTPHWHGNTVVQDRHRVDVLDLLPASAKVVDMLPDNPGIWLFHCHVNDHIAAGMTGRYQVLP